MNAGIARVAAAADTEERQFDELFATNVRGPYFLLKHAIPVLSEGASVILTSSAGSLRGIPGLSAYSASKAALRSLGITLAIEIAPRKIRVNPLTPGPINTPIGGKMGLTPEQMAGFGEMIAGVPLQLLISTPMYNFTIPAVLKSWIDYVVRPGYTFRLAPGWPPCWRTRKSV